MRAISTHLLFYILIFSPFIIHSQDTIRVPLNQPTIQQALDSSNNNTVILVSPGIYLENLIWPKTKYGIKLISTHGRDSTIIDGNQVKRVLEKTNYLDDFNSLIQGFTIQNGNSNDHGGGMYIEGKGTTLKDLFIKDNKCTQYSNGGGANLTSYAGAIDNCIFQQNNVYSFFASRGGGLYIGNTGIVEISNSTFQNNSSGGQSTNSANGAGLYVSMGDTRELKIKNCRFTGNTNNDNTWTRGAGLFVAGGTVTIDSSYFGSNKCSSATHSYGGAIYSEAKNFSLLNSELKYNGADSALAIMFYRDEANSENSIINCRISENAITNQLYRPIIELRSPSSMLEMRNCIIANNKGKAIFTSNTLNPKSELTLNHCTVAYNWNSALEAKNTIVNIQNSILYNGFEEIILGGSSVAKVNSSFVEGGYAGGGNTDGDPLLDDKYSLRPKEGSPCLAAAHPAFTSPFDIYGNTRPSPSNTLADMGAIEVSQKLSYADVRFYLDENENGIKDAEERFISLGAVKYQDEITYSNVGTQGVRILLDTGMIRLSYDSTFLTDWKLTSQSEYQIIVDTTLSAWDIEFGMIPETNVIVAHTFISGDPFRCGEIANVYITLSNEYAPIYNGILWMEIDDRITSFSFGNTPDTIISNQVIGWFIDELFPGEKVSFTSSVSVPGIGGGAQLGDFFELKSWVEASPEETLFKYQTELRCSYDPNDKIVSPQRQDSLTLIDEILLYTIRFQNTGNDYARHVIITDTIDVALDPGSFRLIHTSHPDQLEIAIEDNRIVHFNFRNIFLQDSTTNFEESQGYVSYSLMALTGVHPGTRVDNKAEIYFDFNPPIVTNTVSNILVNELFNVCHVHPGNDTVLCIDFEMGLGEFYLGLIPVNSGGTAPFTYTWHANYTGVVNNYTASFFLNDTTIANPLLIEFVDDPVIFHLTVIDSLGQVCKDSVTIDFSSFILTLDEKYCHLHPGDSCQLYTSVIGGIGQLTYEWTPTDGLADPSDVNTWASPEMTTDYTLLVTDSAGCQITDVFHVIVDPVSTYDFNNSLFKSSIAPNPVSDIAYIQISELPFNESTIEIYDALGQRVNRFKSTVNQIELDCTEFLSGLYLYKVLFEGRLVASGKFVVE